MKILKIIVLLSAGLILCTKAASAQILTGTLYDEISEPLAGAEIYIPAINRGASANNEGRFTIKNLPEGVYTVRFSFLGYKTETRRLNFFEGNEQVEIRLLPTALNLQSIIVTSGPQPSDALNTSQSVVSLDEAQLLKNRGGTLLESLNEIPGLSTFTTGNGIAKPVIRGLTSQRVLVVVNGVRQEGQQWGDEHSPEIDPYSAERIEVVKGPSSVLYGSDALGGVVNVIKPKLPTSATAPLAEGNLNLSGYSNSELLGGSLSVEGASGTIGYRGAFTRRESGNIETPRGPLTNTALEETNSSLLLGTKQDWGQFTIDYSRVDQRLEIFEDPAEEPDATPFQTVVHDRLQADLNNHFSGYRLETQLAYQNNNRKEFEEADATAPELNLVLQTGTADLKLHHKPFGDFFGTAGLSVMTQRNQTLAEEKLIPEFVLYNLGAFIYEELDTEPFVFSGGLRYDTRTLNVGATPDLNVEAQNLIFNSFSGNLGGVWRIAEPFAFSVNAGRGWRAPTAFELFVDGVHEGTARFETGDADLDPESSFNIDGALRYISPTFQSELSVYNNTINDYIFPNPTDQFDPESGFRKFQYEQTNARIYGLEYSVQAQLRNWLIVSGGYSVVRGTNRQIDEPLPLIPADKLSFGTRFTTSRWSALLKPFAAVETNFHAEQDRVANFETTTGRYTLVDVSIGSEFRLGSNRMNVILQADNLFDEAYRSHLSRYKDVALNQGRNVKLKIEIPFGIQK